MIEATYIDHMGSDLSVVNAARVSFGKKSDWMPRIHNGEPKVLQFKDDKLIKYLAKHKHISPFGHAFASFHVKAPVFVARQLVKHKFLRWNEISRRYVDEEPELYEPDVWRRRSADKKQGSEGAIDQSGYRYDATAEHLTRISNDNAVYLYNHLLWEGVCPEQARMVLPQSMMTEWYWSGSLDAFADMCHLRCKSDTQLETQIVANYIDDKMQELFPISWEALRMYAE
jgi:thymidylate synthase (FAD)